MMEASEFEAQAIVAKEDETELFRRRAEIAWVAVNAGPEAKRWLAALWAVSAQTVKRLAQVWDVFPHDDITPDVPLPLYNAVLDIARNEDGVIDTAEAQYWLQMALFEEWSPREVRDAGGASKGRHLSSTPFHGDDVVITMWDVPTGTLTVTGMPLSGAMPERARVTVREVLQE